MKYPMKSGFVKSEIRVLGIDDSPFEKFSKKSSRKKCIIIGTVFRGGKFIDGIMTTKVNVDGNDATRKIIEMIDKSKFRSHLRVIFFDGIAVAGFNVIDIQQVYEKTHIPIIVIMRRSPDVQKIKSVLQKIGMKKKIAIIEKAGPIQKAGKVYTQSCGLNQTEIESILKITATHSLIPEALRVAHLIGAGIGLGESHGDA
jgi:uncharacterized protein